MPCVAVFGDQNQDDAERERKTGYDRQSCQQVRNDSPHKRGQANLVIKPLIRHILFFVPFDGALNHKNNPHLGRTTRLPNRMASCILKNRDTKSTIPQLPSLSKLDASTGARADIP